MNRRGLHSAWLPQLLLVPLVALAGLASGANAQRVAGGVTGPGDSPVPGALVELRSPEGNVVARGLTGAAGAFILSAPGPGEYVLTAGIMGYHTARTATFPIGAGETARKDLVLQVRPVSLAGVRASVEPRCGDPAEGSDEVARVWEDVRRALSAVVLVEASPFVLFRTATTTRDRALRTGRVLRETVRPGRALGSSPFATPPLEEVLRTDFIRADADTLTYYAPDPTVLTAPAFLDRYCFSVLRSDGEVGLAFQPLPGSTRSRPGVAGHGVRGVLWLDEAAGAMRRIEYRYVDPPFGSGDAAPGGRIELLQLANGAWIIQRWEIRMPQPAIVDGRITSRVVAIRETIGEVVEVRGLDLLTRSESEGSVRE